MAEGQNCRVHIRVSAPTAIGQTVAIGGSCKAMGNFDKSRVIHLVTTPDSYPVWYTEKPIILPRFQISQYKYCTVEGGTVRAFERVEVARMMRPNDMDTYIEDTFNPLRLEGSGIDTEQNLLQEMQRLTSQKSSAALDGSGHGTRIGSSQKLYIVCYHLPVSIHRTNDPLKPFEVSWAESLIAKSDKSVSEDINVVWLGTCRVPDPKPSDEEMKALLAILDEIHCIPIFMDPTLASLHYRGYCKHILWPVFHNVDQLDQIHSAWNVGGLSKAETGAPIVNRSRSKSTDGSRPTQASILADEQEEKWMKNEAEYYEAYNEVSRIFDRRLAEMLQPGDIVWVHDYHLMLLPKMIRDRAISDLRIIFFLHIPFPTSQIFRSLGSATDILGSIICADIIGFHAFDHTRHFLNATKRMLGVSSVTLQGGLLALNVDEREVIVTMSHVSIEAGMVDRALAMPEVLETVEHFKALYAGRRIIVGIDVCQRLSGNALKLAAFDKLLTDRGGGKVVLIQRCLRPGARLGDEETTSSDLRKMVHDLNLRYNTEGDDVVVDYAEVHDLSLVDRVALYLVADVFLLTSIREGLNLMPLEYIYARKDLPHAGVVVASEFSTCSSLLSGSLKVNPFYTLSVADALDKALSMGKAECEVRSLRDMHFITSHPSSMWTKQILGDLKHLDAARNKKLSTKRLANLPERLDLEYVLDAYETSRGVGLVPKGTRVFILDYGGTLLQNKKIEIYMKNTVSSTASDFQPTPDIMQALRVLSDDPHNVVVVVTSLTRLKLGTIFAGFKNLTLVTSNGLVFSWGQNMINSDDRISQHEVMNAVVPAVSPDDYSFGNVQIDDEGRMWSYLDYKIDWKAVCNISVPIIQKYTFRTNGTSLSQRVPGVGWSYFGADPDWGEKQAIQLKLDLEAALANYDVKIVSENSGSLEIVPMRFTKGSVVEAVFDRVLSFRAGLLPTFAFVIGDEVSDDNMFDAFYELVASSPSAAGSLNLRGFTVCVGPRPGTSAALYAVDVKDVEHVLTAIATGTTTHTVSSPSQPDTAATGGAYGIA